MPYAQLTLADHDQNGFVAVVRFTGFATTADVLAWVKAFEPITVERDPDATFEFCLDVFENDHEQVDEVMPLPTQIARRLAPAAVDRVLNERPEPDTVSGRTFAVLPAPSLAEFGLVPAAA